MKQAVMAGSGWEAAAVVAAAWQGLGGWRGGAGGVVDLSSSVVYVPVILQRQFPAIL